MTSDADAPITRFAPSPTGDLHIGGARTALFCWAFARNTRGRFLLRLEDTDQARSSEASAIKILEDLAWLGIIWDDGPTHDHAGQTIGSDPRSVGPFLQSQRADIYDQVFQHLLDNQLAYPAFDTPDELAEMRAAASAKKQTFRYTQPTGYDHAAALARAQAEPHVLRLRAPDTAITVRDQVLGDIEFTPEHFDDFVIRKRDGFPTYHFAVVIDDEFMGVTHVLRGQEHLNNTPKHVALQQALGYRIPVYAHMPLIFNERGAKMSNRERDQAARDAAKNAGLVASPDNSDLSDDEFCAWLSDKKRQLQPDQLAALATHLHIDLPEVSVEDFRSAGYLPEAITNFIALLGWTPSKHDDGSDREKFNLDFLANDFDLSRIGKTNARFDRKKLLAFNTDAITTMDPADFVGRFAAWCARYREDITTKLDPARFDLLARTIQPQSKTFADAADRCRFAIIDAGNIEYDAKAVKKWLQKNDGAGYDTLRDFSAALANLDDESAESFQRLVESFCESRSIGMGQIAQPLRVALTGAAVSPAIGETLAVVGTEETLRRIDRCIEHRSATASG